MNPPEPNIRSKKGQNRPPAGGKSGAGLARGLASLSPTTRTTPGNVPKAGTGRVRAAVTQKLPSMIENRASERPPKGWK